MVKAFGKLCWKEVTSLRSLAYSIIACLAIATLQCDFEANHKFSRLVSSIPFAKCSFWFSHVQQTAIIPMVSLASLNIVEPLELQSIKSIQQTVVSFLEDNDVEALLENSRFSTNVT